MTENGKETKSETQPNEEKWIGGQPLAEVVDATYEGQFVTAYDSATGKPLRRPKTVGVPIESREQITERLRTRVRVVAGQKAKGLKALGRTTEPSEADEDYLAYALFADTIRTRQLGGGALGTVNKWIRDHSDSPLAYLQAARALEAYAEEWQAPLERFAASNHSVVVGQTAADMRAQAADLRERAAGRVTAIEAQTARQAASKAAEAARAKAKRKLAYDAFKALQNEFEGVA